MTDETITNYGTLTATRHSGSTGRLANGARRNASYNVTITDEGRALRLRLEGEEYASPTGSGMNFLTQNTVLLNADGRVMARYPVGTPPLGVLALNTRGDAPSIRMHDANNRTWRPALVGWVNQHGAHLITASNPEHVRVQRSDRVQVTTRPLPEGGASRPSFDITLHQPTSGHTVQARVYGQERNGNYTWSHAYLLDAAGRAVSHAVPFYAGCTYTPSNNSSDANNMRQLYDHLDRVMLGTHPASRAPQHPAPQDLRSRLIRHMEQHGQPASPAPRSSLPIMLPFMAGSAASEAELGNIPLPPLGFGQGERPRAALY